MLCIFVVTELMEFYNLISKRKEKKIIKETLLPIISHDITMLFDSYIRKAYLGITPKTRGP